jgi:DNA mismatch repair protein MutS2
MTLENFIDQAAVHGPDELVVIHGHGTNKVKNGVREFLEKAPYTISFRAGRDGEGGNGVTIVHLDR